MDPFSKFSRSPPCCVVCLRLTPPSSINQCPKCLLVVCSKACIARYRESENISFSQSFQYIDHIPFPSRDHEPECTVLTMVRAKLKRNKGKGDSLYRHSLPALTAAVTPIRMVALKWR